MLRNKLYLVTHGLENHFLKHSEYSIDLRGLIIQHVYNTDIIYMEHDFRIEYISEPQFKSKINWYKYFSSNINTITWFRERPLNPIWLIIGTKRKAKGVWINVYIKGVYSHFFLK